MWYIYIWASLVAQTVKNMRQEMWVQSLGWEDTLEEEMARSSVFLPGESYGQGNLAGYSPWDHKESDTTERLSLFLYH